MLLFLCLSSQYFQQERIWRKTYFLHLSFLLFGTEFQSKTKRTNFLYSIGLTICWVNDEQKMYVACQDECEVFCAIERGSNEKVSLWIKHYLKQRRLGRRPSEKLFSWRCLCWKYLTNEMNCDLFHCITLSSCI